ncbi:MAG: ImmA/IrrE family metallo-endopeptidase [Planctomycetes bacterium]|nr:ImmA/IrrE family metallo-endopeptidase [Planctomycetota bacterium]
MKGAEKLAMREAANCADEVLTALGMETLPVDPFAVATRKDIIVQAADLDSCSGCLTVVGSAYGILYARGLGNEGFERFTVSHELGHFFLPGHPTALFANGRTIHQSHSGFVSADPIERQADYFAGALLMPERLFRGALRAQQAVGFGTVQALAAMCRTSITATAIRFALYADDPVAVIVSKGQTVEYCFMSDAITTRRGLSWLRKGSPVPRRTVTADFNRTASNITGAVEKEGTSMLSDWFDGAPDTEMNEDVVGLGRYDRTLTVLFTDEALDEEGEETGDDE